LMRNNTRTPSHRPAVGCPRLMYSTPAKQMHRRFQRRQTCWRTLRARRASNSACALTIPAIDRSPRHAAAAWR